MFRQGQSFETNLLQVKFMFSKKATKIDEIFTIDLTICTLTCQIIVRQILLFSWEKNTCTTLLGPTRLLICEIFPSKPDFHLHK